MVASDTGMDRSRRQRRKAGRETFEQAKPFTWGELPLRQAAWFLMAAMVVGAALYSSALSGGFVFDDEALPFRRGFQDDPLWAWLAGVRPVLMFSYWLSYIVSGQDAYGFHVFNLLIHVVNSGLVYMVLFRLLSLAGWDSAKRQVAAVVGGTVFLIHPLATESVSYIAGRSESLAAFFMLLTYVVFLGRYPAAISWRRSLAVLALFGMAVATKENAVAMAGVLLLTDLSQPQPFSTKGLRRNYRLYLLMAPCVAFAGVWVARMLAGAPSAGFSFKEFTWYQYAFTQARAIFAYIGLAVIPLSQSVDHDFPISHTVTEHGAILYMALLGALVSAAIVFRRRYSLACFGLLMFLILLAPTSSIVPIADPLVERRLYLPLVGLILIACEFIGRIRRPAIVVSLIGLTLVIFAALCFERNRLWANPVQLWAMAAQESKSKGRPYWELAETLIAKNRCADAVPYLEQGERLMPHDYAIEVAWGKILECLGKNEDALQRLQRAAAISQNSSVYQWIGLLYGEMGRSEEAGLALQKAVQLGPDDGAAYSALGLWYESTGNAAEAERQYRKALAIDSHSREAQRGLVRLQKPPG
jgi:hypothetical protein